MSTPAARPCRPRLTAAQGPRVERRAILARTRDGARAKAKAATSTVLPERRPKAEVEGPLDVTLRLRRCAATLRATGGEEKNRRLHAATLSQRQRRCAPSARHDGALLYPGPL